MVRHGKLQLDLGQTLNTLVMIEHSIHLARAWHDKMFLAYEFRTPQIYKIQAKLEKLGW